MSDDVDWSVINTTELMPPSWRFLEAQMPRTDIQWHTCTALAYSGPARINRIRAGIRAVSEARAAIRQGRQPLLISHLPIMAAITNVARRLRCPDVPQIAFAFNFTALPQGWRRAWYRWALRGIDEVVVFSTYEKELYADWLGIPEERIHFMKWAMDPPEMAPAAEEADRTPYLSSIGGEARDYRLLAEAMRKLPHRRAVIVARPYSIEGIDFPPNVDVQLNLPGPVTWRLAKDSVGLALPLRDRETATGHITFVAAQLLGIPVAVTDTLGLVDYVSDETVVATLDPGDVDAMTETIEHMFTDPNGTYATAQTAQARFASAHSLDHWTAYLNEKLPKHT